MSENQKKNVFPLIWSDSFAGRRVKIRSHLASARRIVYAFCRARKRRGRAYFTIIIVIWCVRRWPWNERTQETAASYPLKVYR